MVDLSIFFSSDDTSCDNFSRSNAASRTLLQSDMFSDLESGLILDSSSPVVFSDLDWILFGLLWTITSAKITRAPKLDRVTSSINLNACRGTGIVLVEPSLESGKKIYYCILLQ